MSKPQYIYVTDQGDVFSSADAPTREDLRFAAVGMLTIVRLADLRYRGTARKWQPITPAMLTRASSFRGPAGAFHAFNRRNSG